MFIFQAVKPKDIDEQFQGGIKLMGFIAFVMLVAGGFATVLRITGAVDELVKSAISLMNGNKWVAATIITLIGLLVTMGIGTSFGTFLYWQYYTFRYVTKWASHRQQPSF